MLIPRHIAVTGASSGIGAALALQYAAPGIRLSLHGRNAERLKAVAEDVRKRGATVEAATGDVTDADAMAGWIGLCHASQPIDLLIANAGISAGTGGGEESPEQSRKIFAVNMTGVLNTVQPAVPRMLARNAGQIAIISSLAGFRGFAGAPSYCASKAAVRVYGEALRDELAPQGVAVSVVCPGFIKTPMTDANPFPMPFLMPAEKAARIIQNGLTRNHARIAFPWIMQAGIRLLAALPQDWIGGWSYRMPRKPAKP